MKNATTDAEIVEALRLLEGYKTVAAASRASGIPVTTLKDRRNQAAGRGLTAASKVITDEDRLRAEVRQLTADVKRLQMEKDTIETVRERMFHLAASPLDQPPAWLEPHRFAANAEVPVLFVSDIHFSEVVNPVDVAGVNKYNSEIAESRLQRLFQTAVKLIDRDTGKTPVPGVVLALGGDLISGDIHEELQDTNDLYTTQAMLRLVAILSRGIRLLADKYKRVFVPGVVGNHGRMSKRPRMKGRVYTSFEFLIYCMLEREFKDDRRVSFMIPGETDAYFKINGKRFVLTHGDSLGVRGGDGIIGAIGPIMRGTIKLGVSEAQIGRDFDYLMMGHWHYPLYLPHTLVNGAVKGYDEYARIELRVPYAPASQLLFRVHPTNGLTSRREIILQEPKSALQRTPAWVEVLK